MKTILKLIVPILCCLLLGWWWRMERRSESGHPSSIAPPPELVPFRTPGGLLHTNGFRKTETLHKETGSWRGTTTSSIRLDATYRYEIVLRSKTWNLYVDDARYVAFIVAPPLRPQLPVAVDSRSVYELTESGWGRFDKWENLETLRQETSSYLEALAQSPGYIEIARGHARLTVEEFAAEWLLKQRGWPEHAERFVKVYFADEPNIPFPEKWSLQDFLP